MDDAPVRRSLEGVVVRAEGAAAAGVDAGDAAAGGRRVEGGVGRQVQSNALVLHCVERSWVEERERGREYILVGWWMQL